MFEYCFERLVAIFSLEIVRITISNHLYSFLGLEVVMIFMFLVSSRQSGILDLMEVYWI